MFPLPELKEINIVGIDPGTTYMGFAVMKLSPYDYTVESIQSSTLIAHNLPTYNPFIAQIHGDRFARISAYYDYVLLELNRIRPSIIASEAAFYNPRNPGAYAALVECIQTLRQAVWRYDPTTELITIAPRAVKKAVGAKGLGKDMIPQALSEYPAFKHISIGAYDEGRTEHSDDACAVCAAVYEYYIKGRSL